MNKQINTMKKIFYLSVIVIWCLSAEVQASVVFNGNFETGDYSQWDELEWNTSRPEAEQFEIVTSPKREGQYSAKMTVHDGDEFESTGGERVQLERPETYNENDGDEYWYSWSTYFPSDWQNLTGSPDDDWLLIAAWHSSNPGPFEDVCQPLQFEINGQNQIIVRMLTGNVEGYDCYTGPGTAEYFDQVIVDSLDLGEWNDFVVHIKWKADNTGLLEVWHKSGNETNFARVLNRENIPTLQYIGANIDSPYFILAHYRSEQQSHTSVLYQDGFKQMSSVSDLDEQYKIYTTPTTLAKIKLLPPTDNDIYFGAFPDFGGPEDIVTTQRMTDFENLAGKHLAFAPFSVSWLNGIIYPQTHIHTIANHNVFPIMRLMPRSDFTENHAETVYSLQKIIDGQFDVELEQMATDIKSDNIPIGIDFAVEPTGDWFGWSGIYNGGGTLNGYGDPTYPDGPERWRDAYRHIIDIFRAKNVDNVTWFFHPDIQREPDESWNDAKNYYPGDNYIDWIGISIYGAQIPDVNVNSWTIFSDTLADGYQRILDISNQKPFCVLEFGVTDDYPSHSKSDWLNNAFSTILNNPYINFSAINYWHENWENEDIGSFETKLRIDSSSNTLTTFKNNIDNTRFVSNIILSIQKAPIYRLYNKRTGAQLYTRGIADRDKILNKYHDFEFTDGVPAFYASLTNDGTTPIYRLYNKRTGAQLYTIGVSDRDKILNKYKDFEFTDGSPAFYASLTDDGTTPIFRVYNTRTGVHLYTRGEADRDKILSKWSDFEFTDGVPAFYASLTI